MQLESSMNIFLTIYIVNIGAFAIVQQHINVDLAAQLKECHRKIEASKVALETPHKKLGFMSEGAELAKDPQIDNDKHKIILTTLKERCKRGRDIRLQHG